VSSGDDDDKTVDYSTVTLPADLTTVPSTLSKRVEFVDGLEDAETEEADKTLRYQHQGLLGQGGNGVVISVYDKKMRRPVALKLASTSASEREAQARFLREAQVTGQLTHPNVMPVYDIGTDLDGHVFFTMKQVQGRSLRQLLRAGKAGSLVERLLVFRQICNALAFAHSRGVLHRDLKPANVMVGEFGEVLVVDWGLCKVLGETLEDYTVDDAEPTGGSLETQQGDVAGTPAYMSPEQAQGEIDALDPRTDVYSLGAVLYTLLTDKSPFKGKTVDVIGAVSAGRFVPPMKRAPGQVPREMNGIVMKAMALNKEDRYRTVADLSADVQAFIEGRPVGAVSYSPLQRLSKWAARNRSVVRPVAFTAAFAFVLLVSGGLVHVNRLGAARDAAVLDAVRAAQAERVAQIEAVNGRAAVGTAEALYGRAGAALEQLQGVHEEMRSLDMDTVRADIGVGLLTRSAVLPGVHLRLDKRAHSGVFSDDGESVFVMSDGSMLQFDFHTGQELGRWALPSTSSKWGPMQDGAPWVLDSTSSGISGLHLPSGEQRQWSQSETDCKNTKVAVNSRWVSVGCAERGLLVWPWDQPKRAKLYPFSDAKMEAAQVSDDGRRILVERYKDSLSLHNSNSAVVERGRVIWEDLTRGQGFGLSPDGQWVLKTTATGIEVTHIDTATVHKIQSKVVGSIDWSADSSQVFLGFQEGALKVFDVSLSEVREADEYRLTIKGGVQHLFSDPTRQRWAHIDRQDIRLFVAREPGQPMVDLHLDNASEATSEVVQSASGELVAVGTEGGHIFILDRKTGVKLWDLSASSRPIRGLSFLPSETGIMSGQWDGKARLWNLETGAVDRVFEPTEDTQSGGDAKVTEVNVLDEERVLLTGGDGHIGIWSMTTGELLKDLTGGVRYVWDSAWSAESGRLVVSDRMGTSSGVAAAIYDLQTGELLHTVDNDPNNKRSAYGVEISPDGEQFLVAMHDFSTLVLSKDGELTAKLDIHTPPALEMAWSKDGTLAAGSDYSGKFQIWTTHNWEAVASVGLDDLVSGLLFDPDRRVLLAVSYSGELHELDLGGRPRNWTNYQRINGEPEDEAVLHTTAWRRAAATYDWVRAAAELDLAIAAGQSVSGVERARYKLAAGDLLGAREALAAGGEAEGLSGVWRGALGQMTP